MINKQLKSFGNPLDEQSIEKIVSDVFKAFPERFSREELIVFSPIQKIKEHLSVEAFTILISYLSYNYWKSDGWWIGIFGNNPEIVPHIEEALENIGCLTIAKEFNRLKELFPKGTKFTINNQDYCDTINFMQGLYRHIENKIIFENYSKIDRDKLKISVKKSNNILEEETEKIFLNENINKIIDYANNCNLSYLYKESK